MVGSAPSVAFALPMFAMFSVTLILVPTSALFSALALALSSFATSFKEGQHYLTPLFIVAMPLGDGGDATQHRDRLRASRWCRSPTSSCSSRRCCSAAKWSGLRSWRPSQRAVYALRARSPWRLRSFKRESVLFRGGAGKSYDAKALQASRSGLPAEGHAVFVFFTALALMFFLSGGLKSTGDAVYAFVMAQAAVLLPTLIVARRTRVNREATFSLRPFAPVLAPVVMLMAVSGLVLVMGVYGMLVPEREAQGFEHIIEELAKGSPWVFFALLAVLPPICEELVCRGFLLSAFRTRFGARGAIVLSAAFFGLLHLDLMRFPVTFAAGLILGFVLVRTGSIFATILFHMAWNGTLAAAMLGYDFIGDMAVWKLGAAAAGLILSLTVIQRATQPASPADARS